MTHSQFVLLAGIHWLTLQKQNVTQVLLSNHTKIDPMTTSTVLRLLEKKGLVERQEHKTDTRAKTVGLSEKGIKCIKQAIKTVEHFDKQFFSSLKKNTKEFNNKLIKLLENKNST